MTLMAESQTGKHAFYDEWGNRHLFASHREYRWYMIQMTMAWLLGCCSYPIGLREST